MSRKTKVWLIAAALLVVAGLVLMVGVITACNWDFTRLNTASYEKSTHEFKEDFDSIFLYTNTADIFFVPSEDDSCSVICHELEYATHAVGVQDGTLTIRETDTRKWYDYIGVTYGTPSITVFLPAGEYGKLFIKESTGDIEISKDFHFESMDITTSTGDVTNYASTSASMKIAAGTGDIRVENITAASLDLSVSTGKVTVTDVVCEGDFTVGVSTGKTYLTDIACRSLTTSGNTGDISLNRVIAAEAFHIVRTTGDVEFDRCDAAEIFVETDTGDVEGTLLTDKVFFVTTDTGDVEVPRTATGGRCEIITDTGDVEIDIF